MINFLDANQDLIIIIAVIISVLGITILAKWLKKKNIIDENDTEFTKQLLVLAQLILTQFNFKDVNMSKKLYVFFDIADIVVDFLAMNMDLRDKNKDEISEMAYNTTLSVLDVLNIEVDGEKNMMIKKGVSFAVGELM